MSQGSGPYRVMPPQVLAMEEISLRAVEPLDIESIRQWRNAQMDVLRQSAPLSAEDQVRYFDEHVWPEKPKTHPAQILVAIEQGQTIIGYGGLVHISWPNLRAEVSFLLTPELEHHTATRSGIFRTFLALIQELAFIGLGLRRLFTETVASRDKHIEVLEAAGFVEEGRLRGHMIVNQMPIDAVMHGCLEPDWGLAS